MYFCYTVINLLKQLKKMKKISLILSLLFCITIAVAQNTELSKLTVTDNELYYLNNKPYTGKVFAKHDNGNIGLVGEIKNGKKEGTWTYWYSNGKKKRESTYINNKKEGITYYWHPNGQVAKEIMYRDDKNIDQKLWDANGNRLKNPGFQQFKD